MKKKNIAEEPITSYGGSSELNADVIWKLFRETDQKFKETELMFQDIARRFQETDRQFKETDRKFQETDRQFKETDRMFQETDRRFKELDKKMEKSSLEWQEIKKELGGIGKTNGEIAEEYFYSALKGSMKVAAMEFEYIDRNIHRKRKNTEAEYDIVMYNNQKVLVVEVKHNFRLPFLQSFYQEKLRKFKILYPEYQQYRVFGAIAAMTFGKDVKETAARFGFYILTQHNDKLMILNPPDFDPLEVK